MRLYEEILKELLLENFVSTNEINDAIENHKLIRIRYRSSKKDKVATGYRLILIVAYGRMKNGDAIRVYQYNGTSRSDKHSSYKTLLIDKIFFWKDTGRRYLKPPTPELYGEFNKVGDKSFLEVYKVADFDNIERNNYGPFNDVRYSTGPKTKTAVRKQVMTNKNNITNFTDIDKKTNIVLKQSDGEKKQTTGPKRIGDIKPKIIKTSQQVRRDVDVDLNNKMKDKIDNVIQTMQKKREEDDKKQKELEQLRVKLGDTSQPINIQDLIQKLSSFNDDNNEEDKYTNDEIRKLIDDITKK